METLRQLMRNRALLTFMLGHFTVDLYAGVLPVLYPLMALEFSLTKEAVGIVALAFTATSSLVQPLFGYLADRFGSRVLAPASVVWAALMVAVAGLAPTVGFLMLAASLAGLGSGAYHPLGASSAAAVTGELQKTTAMSIYTVGGSVGYALGPLLGALAFGSVGPAGSVFMLPVGLVSALLILRSLWGRPGRVAQRAQAVVAEAPSQRERIAWRPLLPVVGVTMLRSWVSLSLITFIPLWYADLGYGAEFYGPLTTLVIGGGAVGTLLGGLLADRFGQRRVLLLSLACTLPALVLFVGVPGPIALATGALYGMLADSSLSITLVMAQRALPGRTGLASGFILGLGFVTGGIGVPLVGRLADAVGMPAALLSLSVLLVAAVALALWIPRDAPQRAPAPSAALARGDD